MIISAKLEYASVAVLELAARYESGEPVRIRDIADAHGIPSRFLVQILLQLKGAGLVQSTRGATGGYTLSRPADQISLAEVMTVIEGPGTLHSNIPVQTPATRALLSIWSEVAATERTMLESTTFGQLAEQLRAGAEEMWHI
jgi:Rrf2 family protein